MRLRLTVEGAPVPLQRARSARGRYYLPKRSRLYRELVQTTWMQAGRPSLGDVPLACSLRFYGARGGDIDNLVKGVLDALSGLAFDDDRQIVCLSGCHKLPADDAGARTELELWPVDRSAA